MLSRVHRPASVYGGFQKNFLFRSSLALFALWEYVLFSPMALHLAVMCSVSRCCMWSTD